MFALDTMRRKTAYMMEALKYQAIEETFKKWEQATHSYYSIGYDNGETTKYYKELEDLGANMEALVDIDLEIRDMYM